MSENSNHHTAHSPLYDLEDHGEFISRHIGPREEDIHHMLEEVGATSLDELVASTLPPSMTAF